MNPAATRALAVAPLLLLAGACADLVGTRDRLGAAISRTSEAAEPGLPQGDGLETPSRSPSGGTLRLQDWSVEAFWVPFLAIDVDTSDDTGSSQKPDIGAGSGVGAGVSIGDDDQGIGVLWVRSANDELTTSTDVITNAVYADFHARGSFWQQGSNQAWARFDGGFGVATIDFDGPFEDQTTGAMQLRGTVQLEFSKRASIDVGLGGFLFGVPGNTVAFGTYMTVGGALRF